MNPEIPCLFDYAQHRRNRARAAASFTEFDFLKSEGSRCGWQTGLSLCAGIFLSVWILAVMTEC